MVAKNRAVKLRPTKEETPSRQGILHPSQMPDGAMIDPDIAADWIGIGTRSLARLVKDGRIVSVKVLKSRRRFRVRDVRNYIDSQSTDGAEEQVAEMVRSNVAKARK